MPFFDAPPMPPKNASGTLITSAHGQEMTRKESPCVSHFVKFAMFHPKMNGGTTEISTAAATTHGV